MEYTIKLEYMKKEDLTKIIKWNENAPPEFLMQWAGPFLDYPLTLEQLENYMDKLNINGENTDTFFYKIVDEYSDKMIGCLELGRIDRMNSSARIGKVLIGDSGTRGKGIGRMAINHVLKIGFDKLKLHRITLGVFDFNESAQRCYKSAGFKIDGIMKESRRIGDKYWNLIEMSILEREWRVIQQSAKAERQLKLGGRYMHYKGREYLVISVARHSETLEEMVVYKQLYGEMGIWVRPLDMFLGKVYIDGNLINRFEEIS